MKNIKLHQEKIVIFILEVGIDFYIDFLHII